MSAEIKTRPLPQPGPQESPQIVVREFINELETGSVVSGFQDLEQLDLFVTNIAHYMNGSGMRTELRDSLGTNSGKRVVDGWHQSAKTPSQIMMPPKFYGKLGNIEVLMLEKPEVKAGLIGRQDVELGLFADMLSSGRGKVGKVAKKCKLSLLETPYFLISAAYTNLRANNAEKAAELLAIESDIIATKLIMDGLRHIYSAGLPSLGKKSR